MPLKMREHRTGYVRLHNSRGFMIRVPATLAHVRLEHGRVFALATLNAHGITIGVRSVLLADGDDEYAPWDEAALRTYYPAFPWADRYAVLLDHGVKLKKQYRLQYAS